MVRVETKLSPQNCLTPSQVSCCGPAWKFLLLPISWPLILPSYLVSFLHEIALCLSGNGRYNPDFFSPYLPLADGCIRSSPFSWSTFGLAHVYRKHRCVSYTSISAYRLLAGKMGSSLEDHS
ncbi:hypothetical protein QCA50_012477 [Cerrena zonata]|uniref:Uncharacterized protein n=1 Tax=Cerrena zonata TaxID=2478898 RepID=A0AAW0G077_9APHY